MSYILILIFFIYINTVRPINLQNLLKKQAMPLIGGIQIISSEKKMTNSE